MSLRFAVNPIQRTTRVGSRRSRSRRLARYSIALRESAGNAQAARDACIALRDAFELAARLETVLQPASELALAATSNVTNNSSLLIPDHTIAHGNARAGSHAYASTCASSRVVMNMSAIMSGAASGGSISVSDPALSVAPMLIPATLPLALVADAASAISALTEALALHAGDAGVVLAACEGLQAAAANHAAYFSEPRAAGALQGLVGALRVHGTASPSISRAASGALALAAAAATSSACVTDIAAAGGISALVGALRASISFSDSSAACRALAEMSVHEDTAAHLAEHTVVEVLADTLAAAAAAATSASAATSFASVTWLSDALPIPAVGGDGVTNAAPQPTSLPLPLSCWTAAACAARAIANIAVDDGALRCFVEARGAYSLVALLEAWLRGSPSVLGDAADATTTADTAVAAAVMATQVAEAMCTLNTTARGAAALFKAGAIPALLRAIRVGADDADSTSFTMIATLAVHSKRQLVLWEAVCWALGGFAREGEHLHAMAAAGAAATLKMLLAVCNTDSTSTQDKDMPTIVAEDAEVTQRVRKHARVLLEAFQAADCFS